MAGLFQVLWGEEGGGLRAAEPLKGSDGQLLLLPGAGDDGIVSRICTRPTAVDHDGNGTLDIVSGNFGGTFVYFAGTGPGAFAPDGVVLKDRHGEELSVDGHSDPVFYDWDGDGDLDLLSGCMSGGVYLATNQGSRTEPAYDAFVTLVLSAGRSGALNWRVTADDSHLKMPQNDTRIWVDDVDGDGKADLLVGDSATVITPAEGLSVAEAQAKYDELMKRQAEIFSGIEYGEEGPSEEQMEEQMKRYGELEAELAKVVVQESTGFVWLYKRR